MIDGCHSFIEAASHLRNKCGASKVYLIATHAILSGDSVKEIEECPAVDAVILSIVFGLILAVGGDQLLSDQC